LGKIGSEELPKELSPELKQRFEVMEQAGQPQPMPSVVPVASPSPSPLPLASDVNGKKNSKRGGKGRKKGAKGGEPQAAASPAPTAAFVYPDRRPAKDPLWTGEKLTFDVSYFAVSAGLFTLEILPHKKINDREVYHIRGNAVTSQVFNLFYRLNDSVETFLDFQGLFSHRFHIVLDETQQSRDALELYDHEKAQTYYWNRWNHKERGYTETKEFQTMPRFGQDSLSVLYYLRTLPLPDGSVTTIPVVSEGKSWDAVVTVLRRERMSTPMGWRQVIVLKPETRFQGVLKKQGDSFLYLTDDENRIPVRLEAKVRIGTVVGALIAYEPGSPPEASAPAATPAPTPAGGSP
jgi:hypothetical protein